MRRVSIFAALFALLFVVSAPVSAAPKGEARDPDVGKKLYQFNVLAKPNAWVADNTTCPNNGSRIFFQEDGDNTLGTLHWTLDPAANQDFNITDATGFFGTPTFLWTLHVWIWKPNPAGIFESWNTRVTCD